VVIKVNRAATKKELDARKGEVQLYVVSIRPTEKYGKYGAEEAAEYSRQHLLYLWELEAAGQLFAAGPLERLDANGPTGMLILAAASKEEAITIAENEPHHKAGRRVNTVKGWTVNEGRAVLFAEMMVQLAGRNEKGEK
jgi:uncharacterized protein YciI